ncbi:hypothetical protein AB0P05_26450 [Streptomyces flaveolus]|uniref:hypothetical protein n=1 Tax=Streptomyces flaveolus TaxID=67297 RepID=UPI00343002F2
MANVELLHKVLRHIKENPDEYDPVRWHRDFAGWTLRLALPGIEVRKDSCDIETMFDGNGERVWISDIGPWAQKLLGIDDIQARALFSGTNTLDDIERHVSVIAAGWEATA